MQSELAKLRHSFGNTNGVNISAARQCRAEEWPAGHALLSSIRLDFMVNPLFIEYYTKLVRALIAAESSSTYLWAIPGDLLGIIRHHFRTECISKVDGQITHVSRFMGILHSYNDVPGFTLSNGELEWAQWYKYGEQYRAAGPHRIEIYSRRQIFRYNSCDHCTPGYTISLHPGGIYLVIRKGGECKPNDYMDNEIAKTTIMARHHAASML